MSVPGVIDAEGGASTAAGGGTFLSMLRLCNGGTAVLEDCGMVDVD